MADKIEVKIITAPETYPLRHKVLRPHLGPEHAPNPGDDAPDTLHFGTFLNGQLVSIASVYKEMSPEFAHKVQFRLRGMATDPAFRKRGLGAKIIAALVPILKKKGADLLWFNAREVAFPFYERLGFKFRGDFFELPGIGPHKIMYMEIR